MSENLTNCYSRAQDAGGCPRCTARQPWEIVAEVNNLLARGAHRANPAARAIAWSWAWGDWGREIVARLTEGQIVQCTAEEALTTFVGGVEGSVLDYTLSQTGPGETAKRCGAPRAHAAWKLAPRCRSTTPGNWPPCLGFLYSIRWRRCLPTWKKRAYATCN